MKICISTVTVIALLLSESCGHEPAKIALNWVPEPEFGGIYQAKVDGTFDRNEIDASIQPGGAGAPTWQLVASGKADFAVASADEVIIARSQGADVVAVFAIYQTCPQGIMVHRSRGLTSIEQVFQSGTLAMEVGLPYGKFLQKKYGFDKVKRIPYDGGIGNFLADRKFAQQCFVFSEPIAARRQGANPQTFLIADAGYNPYTGVVITTGKIIRDRPELVKSMVTSLQQGWRAYLDNPAAANKVMGQINKSMDAQTFAEAAEAQKPLIETDATKNHGLGFMSLDRWQTLVDQLVDLKIVDRPPTAESCFFWSH